MLVDLEMPDVDGCSLVRHFRQNPAFAQTRIVAVTGHADELHTTLAMKAGFDAVLLKPVTLTDLKAVFASVAPVVAIADQSPRLPERSSLGAEQHLPSGEK
jgi:CheY-like chemotaxis protein